MAFFMLKNSKMFCTTPKFSSELDDYASRIDLKKNFLHYKIYVFLLHQEMVIRFVQLSVIFFPRWGLAAFPLPHKKNRRLAAGSASAVHHEYPTTHGSTRSNRTRHDTSHDTQNQ